MIQYDELEAQFFQSLRGNQILNFLTSKEQGAHSFQTFGGTDPQDDSKDVLDLKKKPYRDLILQNQVTIFDFQSYLFARQVQLLIEWIENTCWQHELNQGADWEGFAITVFKRLCKILQRSKSFITSFSRTIREYDVTLNP